MWFTLLFPIFLLFILLTIFKGATIFSTDGSKAADLTGNAFTSPIGMESCSVFTAELMAFSRALLFNKQVALDCVLTSSVLWKYFSIFLHFVCISWLIIFQKGLKNIFKNSDSLLSSKTHVPYRGHQDARYHICQYVVWYFTMQFTLICFYLFMLLIV